MARKTSFLAGAAFAAATLVTSFSALAEKPAHPLLNPYTTASAYAGDLLKIAADLLGPPGSTRGGGALVGLENALKQGPQAGPRFITYPSADTADLSKTNTKAVFYFGLPGEEMWQYASLPFCIQQSHQDPRILAVGSIPPDGHVREFPAAKFNGMSCEKFLRSPVSKELLTTKNSGVPSLTARP